MKHEQFFYFDGNMLRKIK